MVGGSVCVSSAALATAADPVSRAPQLARVGYVASRRRPYAPPRPLAPSLRFVRARAAASRRARREEGGFLVKPAARWRTSLPCESTRTAYRKCRHTECDSLRKAGIGRKERDACQSTLLGSPAVIEPELGVVLARLRG